MAAGPGTLEELVEELRPAIRDLVGRLALDLAREEVDRIAASLNRNSRPVAEVVVPARARARTRDAIDTVFEAYENRPRPTNEPRGAPMALRLIDGYFTVRGNEEMTITYWWGDIDEGPRVAIPFPYYSGGIWATTAQGVNWEGGPVYWKHFVTVQNWTNQTRSFRLRSGNLA